jgi:rubrerythrin
MSEYIKKADVVKLCEDYSEYSFSNCDFLGASDFERLQKDIKQLPTADVVEVKHGRWIDTGDEILDTTYSGWKCSECGYVFCGNKFKFCPECGAKMDVSKMEITTEGGKTE